MCTKNKRRALSFFLFSFLSSAALGSGAFLIDLGPTSVAHTISADGQYICGSGVSGGVTYPVPVLWSVPALLADPVNPNSAQFFLGITAGYSLGEVVGMGLNGVIAGTLSTDPSLLSNNNRSVYWPNINAIPNIIDSESLTSCISAYGNEIIANISGNFWIYPGPTYPPTHTAGGVALSCNKDGSVIVGIDSGGTGTVWTFNGSNIVPQISLQGATFYTTTLTGDVVAGAYNNNAVYFPLTASGPYGLTGNTFYNPLSTQTTFYGWISSRISGLNNSGAISVGQYVDSGSTPHGFRLADSDGNNAASFGSGGAFTIEEWIQFNAGTQYLNLGGTTNGPTTSSAMISNAVGTNFIGNAAIGTLSTGNAFFAVVSGIGLIGPTGPTGATGGIGGTGSLPGFLSTYVNVPPSFLL